MDNTYKVWNVKRFLKDGEVVLCPDGVLMYHDDVDEDFYVDNNLKSVVCHAVGLKDKNGVRLYANDIIQTPNGTMYIIQYERLVAAWQAWDFKAWAKGFYDAYIPLKDVGCIVMEDCDPPCTPEPKFDDVVRLGTTFENPELCPEIFDDNEVKS